jgi:predicted Zn-dependent protease
MKILRPIIFSLTMIIPLGAHPSPSHSLGEIDSHLAETPNDPALLIRKTELLLRTNHAKLARPIAEHALKVSPGDPAIQLLMPKLLEAEKRSAEALDAATQITVKHPDFAPAWAVLAHLLHRSGNVDDAISAKLRQLDAEGPANPGDFLTAAAWLRDRKSPGDAEIAISILDRAIAQFGPLTGLQQYAIQLECLLYRHDAALKRIDVLVANYQPSASFSLQRADILEAANRHQQAAAACDSAFALLAADAPAELKQKILARKESNQKASAAPFFHK